MDKIGIVQWGTKHGHAKGWLELLIKSNEIKFYGVFEPDKKRIDQLKNSKDKIWSEVNWIKNIDEILRDENISCSFIDESNDKSLEVFD